MKLDRTKSIELLRLRIIELNFTNTYPLFETYSNQQIIKACEIYKIRACYYE